MENRKSLGRMSKRDMKKMCEDLKAIGTKYKVDENEKIILNDILFCLQKGWEQIHDKEENVIQM
jgi:hypothetical protein